MDDAAHLEVGWIQGLSNKSIVFVDSKTICYARGSHICFLNVDTQMQRVLQSPGRGVGAFTASGSCCICAFSEQKLFPSIFVYTFPELQLKNELKGKAQLDYTSLTLSNCGPYLGCCSSIPDHTITIWNWETAEPLCTQPQAGQDVISLTFNPHNWLQLCALGSTSLTVWNIEKSASYYGLKPSVIELPATDGTFVEKQVYLSHGVHTSFPEMPVTAISGQKGDMAERVVSELCTKARLTPAATCWTTTSQLYVGCAEGFLLLVDPESTSVSVLFNPRAADAIPELTQCNFQSLTICKNGLIVVGQGGLVHCLEIKEAQISITKTWHVEGAVTACSPDFDSICLYSNTGQIYMLTPTLSNNVVKTADVVNGTFVAAALLHAKNICVLLTDSGELQLCSADGVLLSSLSLRARGTSLACCPVAQYAAVGTTSGKVLFIDLNSEQQPRLVHQVLLYRCAVDHLIFDPEGHYLLTGASDSHIFLLDAKPSNMFSVIGYTVVPGAILSLSLQCPRGSVQVNVLALCSDQKGRTHDGSILTLLTLPKRSHADPDCVDPYGCLSTKILRVSRYEVPHPVNSCVLGDHEVFAYCHRRKALQRFHLPQDTDDLSSQVVQLQPKQEVRGHPLGPATLVLSAHQLWLASIGRDGLLRVRETSSMEQYMELQCHSRRLGGGRSVSFSADSQTLITVGSRDGSVVCTHVRTKSVDADKVKEAALYSLSMAHYLRNVFHKENLVLTELPEWEFEDSKVRGESDTVVGTEQRDKPASPPSQPTWLENRHRAVIEEDNEKLSETKTNLRKTIRELRDTIQQMMLENENLPDTEHLEQHEFNLDTEEQKRLEAVVDEEVSRVRNELEWEILAKRYLHDVLKRECWASMMIKDRSVEAFHSELKVRNYPLKERTEQDLENLRMVQNIRQMEKAASAQSNLKESSDATGGTKEAGSVEGDKEQSPALTGSFSAQLGHSNPYVYDQFSLKTTEQWINQIVLLQDVIYRIKTAFNAEFEAVHRQKVQELNRVRDRNRQIQRIMLALGVSEKLWEPSLSDSEWPERMLSADDAEIKAEKHLTAEQEKEQERRKLDEQRRVAAKGDNSRDRALSDMMDGVLQVKTVDMLKTEIPPPEFVLTKPDTDWSEEEKRVFKEFEKKTKELNEEKEKYKKLLEAEMKKLQAATWDATGGFDETLAKLFEKKVRCETALHQEELKIACLVCSVLTEEEMRNRELELKLKLDKMLAYKDEIAGDLKRHEEEVELFQETFDSIVAEDKVLDKEFRKEFFDVPTHVVDHLYKLFKRRPRVQKVKPQTERNLVSFKEQHLCGSLATEELDAPENIPEGLNPSIWERLCLVRRTKVESEQKVKVKALTLAEMKTFLQKKREEEKAAQREITNLSDKLESLHKEKAHFQTDIMVQILLEQGQGEVSATGLTADYTDSVLQHRSVVEDFNRTIRILAEQKMASMVERKDFRKGIIRLEWDNKRRSMQIEDFNNKARDIQMLQLTEEQRDYLQKTDQESRASKQVSVLEKTIDFQEKTHLQNVQRRMRRTEQLNRQAAVLASKNTALDRQLSEMQVTLAERMHIYEDMESADEEAAKTNERYQEIIQRKNLENLATAQAEELAIFCAELERLRMKNFPALNKLQHN